MAEVPICGANGSIIVRGPFVSGAVLTAASVMQRVYIGNAGKVQVTLTSALFSATTTNKINLYGVPGDARISGDGGYRVSGILASATIVSTETTISAVTFPYQFVDIEIAPAATSTTVTIAGLVLCGTGGPST